MKNLLFIFLSIVLISSCSKDEMTLESHDQINSESTYIEKADDRRCPLNITQTSTDESGCCIYEVTFTPRQRGTYTLHGGGGIINAQVTLKGTYKWTITTCEDLEICLIYTDWKNQISRKICCETLTCDVIVDCNIDVSVVQTGVDNDGNCRVKICVESNIDTKSLGCGYSLSMDGVDQGSPFKCCWDIIVPSEETVTIEITNSEGQICYSEEYTCDYDCCSERLEWETCLVGDGGSPDCRIFEVSLTPSSAHCVGNHSISSIGFKTGTATLQNPIAGTIEVCLNHQTQNYNAGVNLYFQTENCGEKATGFFYPWQEFNNGTVPRCGE